MGQFGRNPILLVVALGFLLLFVVLPLVNKKKSTHGFSAKDRGQRTFETLRLLDRTEQAYATAHGGRFTSELADLVVGNTKLRDDLALTPIVVGTLSASMTDEGQSYYVQLASDIVNLSQTRVGAAKPVVNCVILRKTSGVDCPVGSITRTGTVPAPITQTTTG